MNIVFPRVFPRTYFFIGALFILFSFFLVPAYTDASTCTHYASPTGGGNGLSQSSPFTISSFWAVAGPGKTLCLLDGTYTGANSMIAPPSGVSGTSGSPITIRAVNDGGAVINGQSVRQPLGLSNNNSWLIVEGVDVHSSNSHVIGVGIGSTNNIIRRVCAWDAPNDANRNIVQLMGLNTLVEDVCAFGTGRKVFSTSQSGNSSVTIRRAWGMWQNSIYTGPKMVYTIAYNNSNATFENVIGTWNEVLLQNGSRYGILAMDRMDGEVSEKCTNSRYFGSIGYLPSWANIGGSWLGSSFGSRAVDCFHFVHNVNYIHSNHSDLRPILGQDFDGGSGVNQKCVECDRRFINVTEIGGTSSSITGWTKTNHVDVNTVGEAPNIWNGAGTSGARVCKRYVNRSLTSDPLWPWPMDARIRQALTRDGQDPDTVFGGAGNGLTEAMESIFGTIPSECRSDGGGGTSSDTTAPSAPTNLSATAVSSSHIDLAWTASTDNVGVTGYRVERCQGSTCTNFVQIASPTGTTHSDTNLSANTTYRYRVRAQDAAGNLSSYSSTVSATTQSSSTTACHLFDSTKAVPENFGAAYNVITTAKEVLLKALCGDNSVEYPVGNGSTLQYIYNQGYLWDGTQWQTFTFSCSNLILNTWCVGNASYTRSITSSQLSQTNYYVSYVCNWTGTQWKCGCRDSTCATNYWNLQAFKQ